MGSGQLPDALAIPPDLLAAIQAEAEAIRRPADDVLRDVIEIGLSQQRWQSHVEQATRRAHEAGLPDEADDGKMSDEYRQDIRAKIAQGVRSLREGRVTDGPGFMARMDAELADLEREGRG
jgi:hypothetical protein